MVCPIRSNWIEHPSNAPIPASPPAARSTWKKEVGSQEAWLVGWAGWLADVLLVRCWLTLVSRWIVGIPKKKKEKGKEEKNPGTPAYL